MRREMRDGEFNKPSSALPNLVWSSLFFPVKLGGTIYGTYYCAVSLSQCSWLIPTCYRTSFSCCLQIRGLIFAVACSERHVCLASKLPSNSTRLSSDLTSKGDDDADADDLYSSRSSKFTLLQNRHQTQPDCHLI